MAIAGGPGANFQLRQLSMGVFGPSVAQCGGWDRIQPSIEFAVAAGSVCSAYRPCPAAQTNCLFFRLGLMYLEVRDATGLH